MLGYLFQPNDLVLQGQSGPWVQETMPGFLASINSKILYIPGGQQDIDLGLTLYFGVFVQYNGARRNWSYACRIYDTVRISYICWALCQRLHTHTILFDSLNYSVLQSVVHICRRGNRLRGHSYIASKWHCWALRSF